MNRIFKTKWSVAHHEYVVTDEKHANRGKPCKSVVAVASTLAALLLGGGTANAAYVEPGVVATSSADVQKAQQSFETDEYKKDWGLTAMHASKAYALGFNGKGTTVAVMDSGALLQKHPELAGDRFTASHVTGQYGSNGNHYQTEAPGVGDDFHNGDYVTGQAFDITGDFIPHVNDTHGTHVTGTVGANRDGNEFHGVAWGSDIVVGNSGATDNNNYGPFQDYNFYYAGWSALADRLVADNGKLADGSNRGGVINNSFGTNTRQWTSDNKDKVDSLPVNTIQDLEYEYFLFQKADNRFVDAAWDAIKDKNVVQIFTTGNRDMLNPYYRPLYPYFNPKAESQWIAVTGLKMNTNELDSKGNPTYEYWNGVNKAGEAKWWTVTAPGAAIYSSVVYDDHYCPTTEDHPLGSAGYATFGGTSMAAPHVAGAMGVLMSRYENMSAPQVRDVMFTTAHHQNLDGSNFKDWTAAEGTPDELYGWGVPDLDKGMYGPGQFLTHFNYSMHAGTLDVWSNDISQVALDARKAEDKAWMEKTANGTKLDADDFKLETPHGIPNIENSVISKEEAEQYRAQYYKDRAEAIQAKLDGGLYDGKLIKSGEGTLVMTGNNTYRGGTTVEGGKLLGFAESFGVTGEDANAKANGKVVVNGGTFGLLETYNDTFTKTGELKHDSAADHSVDVVVNAGGVFQVTAGQNVEMGSLEFKQGAGFTVGSEDADVLKEAYNGKAQTGTVTVSGVTGLDLAVANPDYAFFKTEMTVEGNKLTGTLSRDEAANFATYANTANGLAIANALESAGTGVIYDALIGGTKADVAKTYNTLGDDFLLNTRNASILNGMSVSRAIIDQANGQGQARQVQSADGNGRLWAAGIGNKTNIDYGMSDMDSDFYAGLIGGETQLTDSTKVGAMFGAGQTKNKAGVSGEVKSDDLHFAIYGATELNDQFTTNYGVMHTYQKADASRYIDLGSVKGANTSKANTHMTQVFGELAYNGLSTDQFQLQPYAGLSWIHLKSDTISENLGKMTLDTETKDQDLAVTSIGARAAVPFSVANIGMTAKADVAWNHFFCDTNAEALLNMGGVVAGIEGGELKDTANVGLGVEAQMGQSTTFGVSYTGTYNGDVTSHGVFANVRVTF